MNKMFEDKTEKEIVNNALNPQSNAKKPPVNRGYRTLVFTDVESFIHDIKYLYPTATHLIVINPDQRDADGAPLMVTRELRGLTMATSISQWGRKQTVNVSASWKEVFAYIEKDQAYIKVSSVNLGDRS